MGRGREAEEGEDFSKLRIDLHGCTAETNTTT